MLHASLWLLNEAKTFFLTGMVRYGQNVTVLLTCRSCAKRDSALDLQVMCRTADAEMYMHQFMEAARRLVSRPDPTVNESRATFYGPAPGEPARSPWAWVPLLSMSAPEYRGDLPVGTRVKWSTAGT